MSNKFQFSSACDTLKKSEIRELMKLMSKPDIISFAGGMPDPALFPVEIIKEITAKLSKNQATMAMQYGPTNGLPVLLLEIQKYLQKQNINIETSNLLVTTGAQQALYLIAQLFIDKDDIILVESPTFIGALASFKSVGAKLVSVKMDSSGIDIKDLEEKLNTYKDRVKFLYTIPNFQNPTGITMSLDRRNSLLDFANSNNLVIVEDDPYKELAIDKEYFNIPSLMTMDKEDRVIYLGSFSKMIAPGLRLGFIVADSQIIERVETLKQPLDACSASYTQVLASEFLKHDSFDIHLNKLKVNYGKKRDLMLSAIKKHFGDLISFNIPSGGFFLWIQLDDKIFIKEYLAKCLEQKVAFVSGNQFFVEEKDNKNYIRLAYSTVVDSDIELGIKIMANIYKETVN